MVHVRHAAKRVIRIGGRGATARRLLSPEHVPHPTLPRLVKTQNTTGRAMGPEQCQGSLGREQWLLLVALIRKREGRCLAQRHQENLCRAPSPFGKVHPTWTPQKDHRGGLRGQRRVSSVTSAFPELGTLQVSVPGRHRIVFLVCSPFCFQPIVGVQ